MVRVSQRDALAEAAAASRRKHEYQAMERAWEGAGDRLNLDLYPPYVRARLRQVFDEGWRAATAYHTAEFKRNRRSTTPHADPTHPPGA